MTHIRLLASLMMISAALGGCDRKTVAPVPAEGVVRLSEQFTGSFELIDKNGEAVRSNDFQGKVMLIYFGFTHCPDVCPGDIGVMSAALNELGVTSDQIAPIFISVDPERDTPEVLGDYFAFDDRIIPLTGSPAAAAAARQGFKLFAQKVPMPESALEYTVEHQRFFFIADRSGQPQLALIGGASPQELAALLRRGVNEF